MSSDRALFFLVVPIGLETFAEKELRDWCGLLSIEFGSDAFLQKVEIVKGGIEFELGINAGLLLNRCLKLPSRILQRGFHFSTRDWGELEKWMKQLHWKSFFPKGISEWKIAASDSRMNNEKHLLKFLEEKFEGRFYQKSSHGATAFLRVHDNQFVLSKDTSGEHLHFRGYRKHQGEAPLRENLAAFLWCLLIQDQSLSQIEKALIVDPFVGSGTLLFESLLWNVPVNFRTFEADKEISEIVNQKFLKVLDRLNPWLLNLVGVDVDEEILNKAKLNENYLNSIIRQRKIQWEHGNSLSQTQPLWLEKNEQPVWLICNPPYGGSQGRLKEFGSWKQLCKGALEHYKPERALLLGPERDCRVGDRWGEWECVSTHRFLNGGIRVAASLWHKIKNRI